MGDEHDRLNEAIRLKEAEAVAKGITDHDEVVAWVATELHDDLMGYLAAQVMRTESERIWATIMPQMNRPLPDEKQRPDIKDDDEFTSNPTPRLTTSDKGGSHADST
jgi:hypothetical protein